MVQRLPKVYAFDGQDKLRIKLDLPGAAERLRTAGEILAVLARPPG
jgi:transcription-repair coupling factor (superfamily II helicase)